MKGSTAMLFIVILDAVALLIIGTGTYGVPGYQNITPVPPPPPNWSYDFQYRVLLNVTSTPRLNELVEVNLTQNGIYCQNVNCSDIWVVDFNNLSTTYQIPLFNSTTYDKGTNNSWISLKITNTSQNLYWIYFDNLSTYTNTANQSTFLVWEDNFSKYSNGAIPMFSKQTSGAGGVSSGVISNQAFIWGFAPQGGSTLVSRFNLTNITSVWDTSGTFASGAGFFGIRSTGTGGPAGLRLQDCTDSGCDGSSGSYAIYSDYLGDWLTKTMTTWLGTNLITFQGLGDMAQGFRNTSLVVTASGIAGSSGGDDFGETGFSIGAGANVHRVRIYNQNITVFTNQNTANYTIGPIQIR
jgi:hypothetical protein